MKNNKIKESIFTLIVELLDSAGGDGNVMLVCGDNYRKVADEFEKWLDITNLYCRNYLERIDCDHWVDFHREQGDIFILDRESNIGPGYDTDGKIVINYLYELFER